MSNYAELSKKLMDALGLRTEPVAVTLIKKGQSIPEGYNTVEGPTRHCQSIMRARKGESLCVPMEKNACPVGASALGETPLPEKVRSGEFHFNMGMYESQGAAAVTISVRPAMPAGSTIATVVSPLSQARIEPDVVIVVGLPEQAFWIIPAAQTFEKGGRVTVEMAAVQAACVDSTVIPIDKKHVNISLGCFGCRKTSDIQPEEMLIGIPWSMFEKTVEAVEKMAQGPIPKSRAKA
ncbi:MAG: hypothetical protein A4E32_01312 [Methanomassiliicoccales archaeon PtaU1.Bin124]|nr:MAG: hypothetical protein A4E32_01312 [Methanomassiliicoccales archaeon PtaU1.Bin124]